MTGVLQKIKDALRLLETAEEFVREVDRMAIALTYMSRDANDDCLSERWDSVRAALYETYGKIMWEQEREQG